MPKKNKVTNKKTSSKPFMFEGREGNEINYLDSMSITDSVNWFIWYVLDRSLSKSFQQINVLNDRSKAIDLVWNYLRNDKPPKRKKLNKGQEIQVEKEIIYIKALNEEAKEKLKKKFKSTEDAIAVALEFNTFDAEYFTSLQPLRDEWYFGNINYWHWIVPTTSQGVIDNAGSYLWKYLNELDDFSEILFDPIALLCSNKERYENRKTLDMRVAENRSEEIVQTLGLLFIYAYTGISFYNHDNESELRSLIKESSEIISSTFGDIPPLFLQHSLISAKCRKSLDNLESVSIEDLSILAGVDRKTLVNAKLSKQGMVEAKIALDFLNQNTRNRWSMTDEFNLPMGPKFINVFSYSGVEFQNYYPSQKSIL